MDDRAGKAHGNANPDPGAGAGAGAEQPPAPPQAAAQGSNLVEADSTSHSTRSGSTRSSIPAHMLTHRKPKNFADRLMRVLLNGTGGQSLWWVGDGKGVALHPKNLKRSNLLTTHFKLKDYNAMIRNLNRWGFSRTNEFAVPDGVKVYQCSLFQRDTPHLMLHMRMDSDVQDVFEMQVESVDQNRQHRKKKKKRKSSRRKDSHQRRQQRMGAESSSSSIPTASASAFSQVGNVGGQAAAVPQPGLVNAPNPANVETSGGQQQQVAIQFNGQQGLAMSQGFPQVSVSASGSNNMTNNTSLPGGSAVAPTPQGGTTATPDAAPAPAQEGTDSSALLQGLLDMLSNAAAEAPARQRAAEQDEVLNQILQLSGDFFNHPALPQATFFANEAVNTLLQLLQLHIRTHQEDRAEEERRQQERSTAVANALAPLLRKALSRAQQQCNLGTVGQPQQGQQPAQPQPPQQGNLNNNNNNKNMSTAPVPAQQTQMQAAQASSPQGSVNNMPITTMPTQVQATQTIQQGGLQNNNMPGTQLPAAQQIQGAQMMQQGSFNNTNMYMSPMTPQMQTVQQGSFSNVSFAPPLAAQMQLPTQAQAQPAQGLPQANFNSTAVPTLQQVPGVQYAGPAAAPAMNPLVQNQIVAQAAGGGMVQQIVPPQAGGTMMAPAQGAVAALGVSSQQQAFQNFMQSMSHNGQVSGGGGGGGNP